MVARSPAGVSMRALLIGLADMHRDGRLALEPADREWLKAASAEVEQLLDDGPIEGEPMSLAEFDGHVRRAGSDPKVMFDREEIERLRAVFAALAEMAEPSPPDPDAQRNLIEGAGGVAHVPDEG